ncbi:hypothetical protein EAE96_007957 [Botrytis aclada]|nr:hypothetical protein EAE96_007957 [Botrytis aclada]
MPSIRSLLEGPTGSCTLRSILPTAARPLIYTQLPIRKEVFLANQTLMGRLPLGFASVQSLDELKTTQGWLASIRNSNQDESLKIDDALEDIQEIICSVIEEYEKLMKEENRLRRRPGDIKAMTGTSKETKAKEEMTEDQNSDRLWVPETNHRQRTDAHSSQTPSAGGDKSNMDTDTLWRVISG